MKLFVAISCVLVAASARPQDVHNHYYVFGSDAPIEVPANAALVNRQIPAASLINRQSQYPSQASAANFDLLNPSNWDASNWDLSNLDSSNWKENLDQMNNWWKNSEWRQTLKNWRQGSGSSSKTAVPTVSYPTIERQDTVAYPTNPAATNFNVNEIITNPWGSLDQATAALDDLNKDFPEVLAKVDPTIKDDINEVNKVVIDVCNQMVAGAKPTSTGFNFLGSSLESTCDYITKTTREISLGMDDPAVVSNLIDSLKQFTNQFNSFRSSGASY